LALVEHAQTNDARLGQLIIHARRRDVRARGRNQIDYARAMRERDLTFGIGPAGTGKTYLAVAAAVEALSTDAVRRLVLVRPAVEAG
jgi:phosphate starvation-inducible PhoH-like protein